MTINMETLGSAWEQVMKSLEICLSRIRERDGCEQAVITVCLMNGTRFDTYTVPKTEWETGLPGRIASSQGQKYDFSDLQKCGNKHNARTFSDGESGVQEPESIAASGPQRKEEAAKIEAMTMPELKKFLTRVRDELGLRRFSWPERAEQEYRKLTNDPVPSAPGRSNSKKGNLILILKLSAELDRAWKEAVLHHLHGEGCNEPKDNEGSARVRNAGKKPSSQESGSPDAMFLKSGNIDNTAGPSDIFPPLETTPLPVPSEAELLEAAEKQPEDNLRTTNNKRGWFDLSNLLRMIRYPSVRTDCHWFRQGTPPDGNCLFSSIMVAAGTRRIALESVNTVVGLRTMLKNKLEELSRAGKPGSCFRREWLASCVHDIEDSKLREMCEAVMTGARKGTDIQEIELFLAPLRVFVHNWARMIGGTHWGGLLTAELSLLASITGTAIEVLRSAGQGNWNGTYMVTLCDTKRGNRVMPFIRSGLFLPAKAHMPSADEGFLPSLITEQTKSAWLGPYPVVRVTLEGRHYDSCTSNCSYPISPELRDLHTPISRWFKFSDTLVEPYASLTGKEETVLTRVDSMIQGWRGVRDNPSDLGSYFNTTLYENDGMRLSVSELSRMQVPPANTLFSEDYMLSDDLISCYMDMLTKRAEKLRKEATRKGTAQPPRSKYMHSYFFGSIRRGLQGPTSKKLRRDMLPFTQVIIPALVDGHWLLAVCYCELNTIGVYDPLGHPREDVFDVVRSWAENQLQRSDESIWRFIHIKESRGCVQKGGIDCGVYICKAAESFGLGFPLRVSQWDMPYVRRRMLVEFIHQEATPVRWPR